MAMRLLVSICCIVTSSATGVWSESQFKTKYDAYVVNKDSAAVKTANANIVGEAIPALPASPAAETEMHRWYHDVNAAVQADAKATMDKALADRLAHGNYPTADCMTKIDAALTGKTTWAQIYPVYLSVSGDDVPGGAALIKAHACLHGLSGAQKELAIKAGFQSKLLAEFKTKMTDAFAVSTANGAKLTMTQVSDFVTGTLAAAVPTPPAKETGKETQPMYSSADATLRGEMMHAMVNQLNGQLPAV